MRIPDTTLERLNSQADLVAMIRKHTTLKPAGREFKGCCPFHGEKTPSFYVNPQTNLYYCFGCGVKGNPITFLREFERMSFQEAIEYLSDQTGVDLPKDDHFYDKIRYKKTPPITPPPARLPESEPILQTNQPVGFYDPTPIMPPPTQPSGDLYSLLAQVHTFYQHKLHATSGAMQYFISRGLSPQTIATFGLGYAPVGWQHLQEAFPHDIEGLKMLGLVRKSQKGRDFELLRDRVIFPIKDNQGRVVGFAGRSLGDELPKYINSSESPVFAKQHILYGFYEARQQRASEFVVVEGYMDVIALYQAGIYGAVAPMGTAINDKQIAHLFKYNPTLTLCFDGDTAGQKASWRALEVAMPILSDEKTLKFLTLPDHHDPDTYVKTYGTTAMQNTISQAKSTSDYVFDTLKNRHDISTPEGKAQAMAQLRELTDKLPKGSSFKWWLNSDIYQKLSGKKPKATTDTISYDGMIDQHTQLCLCLLYAPSIIQNRPLERIFEQSGVAVAHLPYAKRLPDPTTLPPLPTWQNLGDGLALLAQSITALLDGGYLHPSQNASDIDRQAHLIMASLPDPTLQNTLKRAWREFFHQNQHHDLLAIGVADIHLLFDELLCQALQQIFKKQHEDSQQLVLSEIHKRRLQALARWDNEHTKTQVATLFERY